MGVELDISQVRAFGARIAGSGVRIGAKAAAVVRRTGFAIERDAKTLAPVDTGNLRNSISTSMVGDGRSALMSVEVGPTAAYGIYQEYGTSVMAAQPFLGPAFDRNVPAFNEAIAQLAEQELL